MIKIKKAYPWIKTLIFEYVVRLGICYRSTLTASIRSFRINECRTVTENNI